MTDNSADESFTELARRAISAHDGPPGDYSAMARLAFEFRDIPTAVVASPSEEFAGARSTTTSAVETVEYEGSQLCWTHESETVSGILLPARVVRIELISPTAAISSCETDEDGTFELSLGTTSPCRLVVRDETAWASPWFGLTSDQS